MRNISLRPCLQWLAIPLLVLLFDVRPAAAAGSNPRDTKRDVSHVVPEPMTETWQIAAWMRRLAGHYRVDGSVFMLPRTFEFRGTDGELREIEFQQRLISAKGAADCKAVGTGPGMQCILNVGWLDEFETIMDPDMGPVGVWNLPGGVAYLNPSMMLVGLDPPNKGVRFQLVDSKGLPEGGSGSVAGNRMTLRAPCVNAPKLFGSMNYAAKFSDRPPQTCERIIYIDAKPEASLLNLNIEIELNEELVTQTWLTLRRAEPDDKKKETRTDRRSR